MSLFGACSSLPKLLEARLDALPKAVPALSSSSASGFTSISARGPGGIRVEPDGRSGDLVVKAVDSFPEAYIADGVLYIELRPASVGVRALSFRVPADEFEGISLSNAASGELSGIDSPFLYVSLRGASKLKARGSASYLDLSVESASVFEGLELSVEEADLRVGGASLASVSVSDYLNVYADGASVVRYMGSPEVERKIRGASSLQRWRGGVSKP